MKTGIHPEYERALITCACGRVTETRSTVEELHVEICSHCHPFFTGRQKLVDTAGRVERFMSKYGMDDKAAQEMAEAAAERAAEAEAGQEEGEGKEGEEESRRGQAAPRGSAEEVPPEASPEEVGVPREPAAEAPGATDG